MRNSQFKVGTGIEPISFPEAFFPHMSFRGRYFLGIKDNICARAVCICNEDTSFLFISVETGDVGNTWNVPVSKATGIPVYNIYITATHTHAAPHAGTHWPEDVADAEQGEKFAARCLDAVLVSAKRAVESAKPAKMLFGKSNCGININRDYKYSGTDGTITSPYIQASNPEGISDKTVYTTVFRTLSDEPIACLFSYAVHSNVTFYQNWDRTDGMLVTGDLAGVAMRYVEQRLGENAVAIFHLGAAADQSPQYLANHRAFDKDKNASWEYYGADTGYALMDAQGTALGISVLSSIESAKELDGQSIRAVSGTAVLQSKLDGKKTKPTEKDQAVTYADQYKETLESDYAYVPSDEILFPVYLARIGSVNYVGIPAEIVTSIGQRIRDCVTAELGGETVVVTQCNDAYSYITDDFGYSEKTFEAVASHFMPGTADRILQKVKELTERFPK